MRTVLAGILSSGLLLACGGGGGGGDGAGGTPPPPQASLLVINAANQDAVGRAATTAVSAFLDVGGGAGAGTGSSSSLLSAASGRAGRGAHSISALALQAARMLADPSGGRRKLLAAGGSAPSARPLAIAPQTTPCDVSGSLTVSFGDADNNGIPALGDTITLAFNQCRDTPAESVNGSMVITLSRFDVTTDLLSFAGTLAIQQVTVTEGSRAARLNGSLSITFAESSDTEAQIGLTVGAAGLSASVSGAGITDAVTFAPGFAMTQTDTISITPGGVDFASYRISGGFSATSINGRVSLETPTPLLQRVIETYPRAGTLRIVGNGSALRLQALDAATVRLELDATLDGIYEASRVLAWATLLPG